MSYRHDPSMRLSASFLRATGMPKQRIADMLGIPRSTVARWFDPDAVAKQRERFSRYSGTCLDCGKRTTGCNGASKAPERCAPCTSAFLKFWTPEVIIAAIQLFHARYGDIPSAEDWNATMARNRGRLDIAERWERDGDYPQSNTVQLVFGSWNAGIAAAGFTPRGIGKRGSGRAPVESVLA